MRDTKFVSRAERLQLFPHVDTLASGIENVSIAAATAASTGLAHCASIALTSIFDDLSMPESYALIA
jgi:hypothetical protein